MGIIEYPSFVLRLCVGTVKNLDRAQKKSWSCGSAGKMKKTENRIAAATIGSKQNTEKRTFTHGNPLTSYILDI